MQHGYEILDELFDPESLQALLAEAVDLASVADDHRLVQDGADERRGGMPARRLLSVPGGEVQTAFFCAPDMSAFLSERSGGARRPSGAAGTYSYYLREGDHLALHRDVPTCEFVLITCLHAEGLQGNTGGVLAVYPDRCDEPISAIRRAPARGRVKLVLAPGQSVLMHGGRIPHALLPLEAGQQRIVSVLCYE